MRAPDTDVRRWWWLESGMSGYLGFRPGANRSTALVLGSVLVVLLAIAWLFRAAGITASQRGGSLGNVAGLLVVCQFVCLAAARAVRRGDLFQDPPGALLPYSTRHRLLLWGAIVTAPIALGLAAAYGGVAAGLAHVTWPAAAVMWLVDVSALVALVLALELIRWTFRTYAPLGAQRLWAFVVIVVLNGALLAFAVLCLSAALQFGMRRVFIAPGLTEALRVIASAEAGQPAAAVGDALRANQARFEGFDNLSAMSRLVTQGRHPSALAKAACGIALGIVLLVVQLLPAGRPEELQRIMRYANFTRAWATDLVLRIWPKPFRLAGRLMLPPVYFGAASAALGAVTLMITAFLLTWASVSPGHDPRAVERVLSANGAVLAGLLALMQLPIAKGIPLDSVAYLRHAVLPAPTAVLLRRMTVIGMAGAATLNAVLAATWGLVVQADARIALQFAAGVVLVQVTAFCAYVALRSFAWRWSRQLGPIVSGAWAIVPAALLIWQFGLLRHRPDVLRPIVLLAVPVAVAAAAAGWIGLKRMVDAREPTAGV